MSLPRVMNRLEAAVGASAARAHRRPLRALVAAGLLVAVGGWLASRLQLDTDLTELLPSSFESVQGLEKLKQNFGGIGYVAIAGYNADPAQLEKFADELTPQIEALPGIRFVEYQRASSFFRDRALYYLSLEDLGEVERRIRAREKYERRQKNPMYIKFDNEEVPSLDFSDIEAKYGGQSSRRLSGNSNYTGNYYLDPDQRLVVLLAKPEGNSSDLGFSKNVVGQVEALLAKQDLKRYGPGFRYQLTGTYKKKVDQQAQISKDLSWSSTVALVLLVGYLLFHFRSAVAVLLNLAPVMASLVWTYGFVAAVYGSVNMLTGFLAAILGGLGIEHGIHLLGRFEALRAQGLDSEHATREAFTHTGGAALISSAVAALTFLSLAISEFRAFREFGVIASVGMLVVIGAYILILPALLGIAARFNWRPGSTEAITARGSQLARWLPQPRIRRGVAIVMTLLLVALGFSARNVSFNYDFAALEDNTLPSFVFDKNTNKVLGYSQTPVVVLTPDPRSERAVVEELTRRKRQRGSASTIDFVAALDDLVPQQQQEKQAVLASIGEVLAKVKRDGLDPGQRQAFDDLKAATAAKPFVRADLPESVRRQFMGIKGGQSGFVLVFPAISLADGAKVREFATEVRSIAAPGGAQLSAAGEAMILADIINMVTREMPRIFAAALISVLVVMSLTLGSLWLSLLCLSPTMVSLVALTGLMPLCELQFNYLNIIVLTVLIGVTVDAGVHLVSRLREAGPGQFSEVYGETGRAICGGILTSAVGFGAMLLADHPGLNSIGQLANLGFATNLLVTLLAFPAFLLPFINRNRQAPPDAVRHNEQPAAQ
jgi:predicted RND superfamily exporter protein